MASSIPCTSSNHVHYKSLSLSTKSFSLLPHKETSSIPSQIPNICRNLSTSTTTKFNYKSSTRITCLRMWEQVRKKMDTHKLLPNIFLFTLVVVVVLGSNSVSGHITKAVNEIGEQALSQIAIEKAVYALHESASVSVHPRVLGLEVTML